MLSVWWPETAQGSSTLPVCWTFSSQRLQLGSCYTWDFLFLLHSRPLPQLPPGAWQQHFLMPEKWEQTIYRYLHFEHLLYHRTGLKTFNNSSAHINKRPLLCSGNIRISQKSTDCQRLFHRQFSVNLTLYTVSFWRNLTARWLYSRQIHYHCPGVPSMWQFTIATSTYYGITVSLVAADLQQI